MGRIAGHSSCEVCLAVVHCVGLLRCRGVVAPSNHSGLHGAPQMKGLKVISKSRANQKLVSCIRGSTGIQSTPAPCVRRYCMHSTWTALPGTKLSRAHVCDVLACVGGLGTVQCQVNYCCGGGLYLRVPCSLSTTRRHCTSVS